MTESQINVEKEQTEQEVNIEREPFSIGGGHDYTAGEGLRLQDYEFSADTDVLATKSDLSGKQDTLTAGNNISIEDNTISATDTTYTAGNNVSIENNTISATDTTYTAGTNVSIDDGVISATDTTYSDFTGTDGTSAGSAGLVPAPATTDADKFLKADGTWADAGGGGGGSGIPTNATFWGQVYNSTNNRVVGMLDFTPDETTLGNKRYINTKGTYELVIQTRSGDGTISLNVGNNSPQFQVSRYSINFKNKRGINLSTPTADGDAATKKYVDDAIAALEARISAL